MKKVKTKMYTFNIIFKSKKGKKRERQTKKRKDRYT